MGRGSSVGIGVGAKYSMVAVDVKVGGMGVKVAVGKGIMGGAGMSSGVLAAKLKARSAIQSHPPEVEFEFMNDLDMQFVSSWYLCVEFYSGPQAYSLWKIPSLLIRKGNHVRFVPNGAFENFLPFQSLPNFVLYN